MSDGTVYGAKLSLGLAGSYLDQAGVRTDAGTDLTLYDAVNGDKTLSDILANHPSGVSITNHTDLATDFATQYYNASRLTAVLADPATATGIGTPADPAGNVTLAAHVADATIHMASGASVLEVAKSGKPYTTIAAAIAAVPTGGGAPTESSQCVILVHPGTYNEHVDMSKSWVNLVGIDRNACRILYNSGGGSNDPLTMSASYTRVANLTITADTYGPACRVATGLYGVTVYNCTLKGVGTLLQLDGTASAVAQRCTFDGDAGGLYAAVGAAASLVVDESVLGPTPSDGISVDTGGVVTLRQCILDYCTSVFLLKNATAYVTQTTVLPKSPSPLILGYGLSGNTASAIYVDQSVGIERTTGGTGTVTVSDMAGAGIYTSGSLLASWLVAGLSAKVGLGASGTAADIGASLSQTDVRLTRNMLDSAGTHTSSGYVVEISEDCSGFSGVDVVPLLVSGKYTTGALQEWEYDGSTVASMSPAGVLTAAGIATPYARTIVVAKSGGDYATVQGAIDSITDDSTPTLILIYPGTYTEAVICNAENVTLRGVARGHCIISHLSTTPPTLDDGDVPLQIMSDGCRVENLTLVNTYSAVPGNAAPALAVGPVGETPVVADCVISGCDLTTGGKDTLYFFACTAPVVEYTSITGYNHVVSDNKCTTLKLRFSTLRNTYTSGAAVNLNSTTQTDVWLQNCVQSGGVVAVDIGAGSGAGSIIRVDGWACDNTLVTALLQANGNASGHLYYNDVWVDAIVAGTYSGNWTVHEPNLWGVGTNLTALNATNLGSGNVPYARMPTGTGTWSIPGTMTVAGTTSASTDYTAVALTGTTSHSSGTMASLSCMTIGPPANGSGAVTTAIGLITKCPTGVGTNNYAHQVQGTMSIIDYGTSPHTNGGLTCKGTWGIACGSVNFPGYGKIVAQGNVGIGGSDTVTGYSVAQLYRYAWIANGTTDPNAGALGLFGGFYAGAGGGLGVRESNILVGTYNLSTYNADYVHLKILAAGNSPTKLHMSAPGTSGGGNQLVDATVFTSDSTGFKIETANNRSMNLMPHGTGVLTVDTDELTISGGVGAAVKTRLAVGSATIPTTGAALQVTGGVTDGGNNLCRWRGVSSTDPADPLAGDIYYDDVNYVVKIYDGSGWHPAA